MDDEWTRRIWLVGSWSSWTLLLAVGVLGVLGSCLTLLVLLEQDRTVRLAGTVGFDDSVCFDIALHECFGVALHKFGSIAAGWLACPFAWVATPLLTPLLLLFFGRIRVSSATGWWPLASSVFGRKSASCWKTGAGAGWMMVCFGRLTSVDWLYVCPFPFPFTAASSGCSVPMKRRYDAVARLAWAKASLSDSVVAGCPPPTTMRASICTRSSPT